MQAFARVAELGSFTRAADELALSRAMVSTHVRRLERRFGVKLLNRTTRKVAVTPAGADYLGHCRRVFAELRRGRGNPAPRPGTADRRLRVDVPGSFGRHILLPALPEFLARYPGHRGRTALQRARRGPRQGARGPRRARRPGHRPEPRRPARRRLALDLLRVPGVPRAQRPAPVASPISPGTRCRIHHRRHRKAAALALPGRGHAACEAANSASRSTRWRRSCWRRRTAPASRRPWTSWRRGRSCEGNLHDRAARRTLPGPLLSVVHTPAAQRLARVRVFSDFLRDLIREVSRRARSATGLAADPA